MALRGSLPAGSQAGISRPGLWMAAGAVAVLALACAVNVDVRADQPEIFVPPPRGAGETLDPTGATKSAAGGDRVSTIKGDRLIGRVVSIDADGKLHLTGPQFSGEATVLVPALDEVSLAATVAEIGQDEVILTNGDRITGELTGITTEHVIIASDVAGPLKVPRKTVVSVGLSGAKSSLIEGNFSAGNMGPWKPRGGSWTISDGTLVGQNTGDVASVYAKLDQKEAVTFVADVKGSPSRSYLQVSMLLFVDSIDQSYGRNSVYGQFSGSEYYFCQCINGSTNNYNSRSFGRSVREGTLRFAYDPETNKARAWIDATDLGESACPQKLASGQYVVFMAQSNVTVSNLRVLRGIVPPSKSEAEGEDDVDVIQFQNKDRVSATEITMTDRQALIKTGFGEVTAGAEKLGRIVFRKKGREESRRQKGDVQVFTAGSRITLQLKELTADAFTGVSSSYGEVKCNRGMITSIRFNIYK